MRSVFYSSLPSILPRLLMITSVGNTRQIDLLHHGMRAVAVWCRRRLRLVHSVLCTLSPLPLAPPCATLPGARSGGCVPCTGTLGANYFHHEVKVQRLIFYAECSLALAKLCTDSGLGITATRASSLAAASGHRLTAYLDSDRRRICGTASSVQPPEQ